MKKLMIAAAVLATIAVAPAFAQTKSAPVDTHTQIMTGPEHDMGPKTTPAQGAKNVPVDTHTQIMTGPEHDMGPKTTPAQGAKNVPVDTHTQIMTGPEHQMPPKK